MDKIILKGCRFYAYHGAFSEEQTLGQIFVIDAELTADLKAASETDNLEDTVHYGKIFEVIKNRVENSRYALIEKLAGAVCQDIFECFSAILAVTIRITKENPPIAGHYDAVGVELKRERP
ncbi:dihydroneopterin aldolase [Streptococcus ratti]|uniref:7,8-dihydroneopterin aldolase n=2 Tax=Streptococcus ratti TaxID=1341 RepID=A0A7X9LE45_STRRT|nr:dihydroneopterin aldolase [Streptococcus ratti]VEI60150.1 dihydroneopterin aldolase [Streptococcus mutans]EJN93841.1 putative dihydroneopterin aldolase [Streptococcus ratti FA-1 = DSM 20564]EMP69113.1 dihydroneopterin aldolase [Streptococcus ratti FA-1 = DSM 20564]NMD48185.1 dihydroneopterin aldolase [Streptococcus ratti]QEY07689.1 dihydroneopterin aldolase [Streptococcus ratti]